MKTTPGVTVENKKSKKPDEWEIKSWVSDITRANEILNDPEKMKYVKPELKKQKRNIRSIDDLIELRNEKFTSKDEE